MSEKNIVGFSLSEDLSKEELDKKLDKLVQCYDVTVELRQKELEDKLNELVLEFQKKENVVLVIKYNSKEFKTRPVESRILFDSERNLLV